MPCTCRAYVLPPFNIRCQFYIFCRLYFLTSFIQIFSSNLALRGCYFGALFSQWHRITCTVPITFIPSSARSSIDLRQCNQEVSAHEMQKCRRCSIMYSYDEFGQIRRFCSSGQKYIVWLVKLKSTQIQVHNIVKHKVYDVCAK